MLDRLPGNVFAQTLGYLSISERARVERVNSYTRDFVRRNGWDGSALPDPHVSSTSQQDLYKGFPQAWKARCREYIEIQRAIAPLLSSSPAPRPDWTRREVVGNFYNNRGAHVQARVALGAPPVYPKSTQRWLQEQHRAVTLAEEEPTARRLQGILDARRQLSAAIDSDDVASIERSLAQGASLEIPELKRALSRAIAHGWNPAFDAICLRLARDGVTTAFAAAGFDPMTIAIPSAGKAIINALLTRGFPLSSQLFATLATERPLDYAIDVATVLRQKGRLTPAYLAPAVESTCYTSRLTQRAERLTFLLGAGAESNAPLPARELPRLGAVSDWAPRQQVSLPPLLAVLLLVGENVLPLASTLVAQGARVGALDASGKSVNAWHCLMEGAAGDFIAVSQWLNAQGVDINHRSAAGPTPLAQALQRNPQRVSQLLQCGASVQGDHGRHGLRVSCLQIAFQEGRHREGGIVASLIRAGAPLPTNALWLAMKCSSAEPLTALLIRSAPTASRINAAFAYLLPRTFAWREKDSVVKLRRLAAKGARVDVLAKPLFHGKGRQRTHKDALAACPGLLPSAALAVSAAPDKVLDFLQMLKNDLGVDLHAVGDRGSTVWHALALVQPPDAVEVARYLHAERVDINVSARTSEDAEITALEWAQAHSQNAALLEIMQLAAQPPIATTTRWRVFDLFRKRSADTALESAAKRPAH